MEIEIKMYKKLMFIVALSSIGASFAADNKGKNAFIALQHTQGYRTDQQELNTIFGKGKNPYQEKTIVDLISQAHFLQRNPTGVVLNLRQKHLTSLEGLDQYPNIEAVVYLDLSENHIEHITAEDFARMHNLKILDLSSNMISELPADIFSNMRSLRIVMLSSNNIKFIHPDALLDCNLVALDLSNNEITSFDPDLVSDQNELAMLYLCNNRLSESEILYLRSELRDLSRFCY